MSQMMLNVTNKT